MEAEVSKRCCSSRAELLEFCNPVFLTSLSRSFSVGEEDWNIGREMPIINLAKQTLTGNWSGLS